MKCSINMNINRNENIDISQATMMMIVIQALNHHIIIEKNVKSIENQKMINTNQRKNQKIN